MNDIILSFENGDTYTKEQFDSLAQSYAKELIDAGYDKTCRLGVYSHCTNLMKIYGVMSVCSVVVMDYKATEIERKYYDVDIWDDVLPKPRYNQCNDDEITAFVSSGSTDALRLIPLTRDDHDTEGLDTNIQIHANITNKDSTINCIPLWACIGFQLFSICYRTGATYHVLDNVWESWPKVKPTFLVANPSILLKLKKYCKVPYETMSIRHIRTVGAPMYKDFKHEMQNYFNCITTDSYGLNETGTISIMHYPQKHGSVGFVLPNKTVTFDNGEIVVDGYYTGDLGYIDDEGFLFITGRVKDVINQEGIKIMPYEVEEALIKCGAIDCVVFGYDSVYAVIVGEVDMEQLSKEIAWYKIPKKVFYVESIPRKGQGKISRKELLKKYVKLS